MFSFQQKTCLLELSTNSSTNIRENKSNGGHLLSVNFLREDARCGSLLPLVLGWILNLCVFHQLLKLSYWMTQSSFHTVLLIAMGIFERMAVLFHCGV